MDTLRKIGHRVLELLENRVISSIFIVVGIATALIITGSIVYRDWPEFRSFSWQIRSLPLLGAIFTLLLAFIINLLTWRRISFALGSPVGFWKDAEIYSFSTIVRRLPGAIWQVMGRSYLYIQEGARLNVPLWGSLWEIFVQFSSGLLLTSVVLVVSADFRRHFPGGAWWLLFLMPIIGIVIRPQMIFALLNRVGLKIEQSVLSRREIVIWIGYYLVSWILGGAILFFIVWSLEPQQPITLLWMCAALVSASGMMTILVSPIPGGLGLRETVLLLLLRSYVSTPVAVAATVVLRLLLLIGETFIALMVFLIIRNRRIVWSKSNTP